MDVNLPPRVDTAFPHRFDKLSDRYGVKARVNFTWRGAHGSGRAYAARDVIEFRGALYLCLQDHDQRYGALHPDNPSFWARLSV